MKRTLIILISVILLTMPAFAKVYAPQYKRIQINLPDSYTAVMRNTDKAAPEWKIICDKRGKTTEEMIKLMRQSNSFLYAINEDGTQFHMKIERRKDTSDDFCYLKKEQLWAYAQQKRELSNFKYYTEKSGKTIDSGVIRHWQTPVMKTHSIYKGRWLITYEVIWQANWYYLYFSFADEKITPEQEQECIEIIQNLVFEDGGYKKAGESELFNQLLDRYPNPEETSELMSAESSYKRYVMKKIRFWVRFASVVILLVAIAVAIVWVVLRIKRKAKERDDECIARATRRCIVCNTPMADEAEVCPSCGTRQ